MGHKEHLKTATIKQINIADLLSSAQVRALAESTIGFVSSSMSNSARQSLEESESAEQFSLDNAEVLMSHFNFLNRLFLHTSCLRKDHAESFASEELLVQRGIEKV